MYRGFTKKDELIPVDIPVVGQLYHVAWGLSRGVVGKCKIVIHANKMVVLETPKTKREFKKLVKWSDLRHTRKNQLKITQNATRGTSDMGRIYPDKS